MESPKAVIHISCEDPRFVEIARLLQAPSEKKLRPGSVGNEKPAPEDITLLLEYEKRGGHANYSDASVINARAYNDPRGAGGMYTTQAGYFQWDKTTKEYVMTDKAKTRLRDWKQRVAKLAEP